MFNTRQFKKKLWEDLWEAQSGKCFYCETEMLKEISNNPISASLDHIKPKEKGGNTSPNNLILCCRNCNMSKNTDSLEKWWKNQSFYKNNKHKILLFYQSFPNLEGLKFLLENQNYAHIILGDINNKQWLNFLMKLLAQYHT